MKKNYKSILLLVSLLLLLILYFTHSNLIVKEIISYSNLFFYNIFPTSFIFLLLSCLLIENNLFYYIQKIIKNPGLYFFLVSLISGYPTGAIFLKDALQKKEIDRIDANRYIMFSHFPNPLFIMFHLNKLFPKTQIPFLFYGIIILSNSILFFITKKQEKKDSISYYVSRPNSFQKSLFQAFSTLLLIYGTSIFFYLLSIIILYYIPLQNYLYVWLYGTFDLTKGIMMSNIISNPTIQGLFLFYFIVFGSLPIHMQIKSILSDTSISYKYFLKGRIISFTICSFLWLILIGARVIVKNLS